jgi:hypothetical protein
MDKDEALKLALDALEEAHYKMEHYQDEKKREQAITAIKQALASPMQPVKPSLWEQYHAAQPAPVEPDWKAEYLKSVESGCITLDELRETLAELDATNRQVEILSDALAESRREVAALKAVQEPVAWGVFEGGNLHDMFFTKEEADNTAHLKGLHAEIRPLTTPPAAQRQWVGLTDEEWQALSDRYGMILFGRFKNEIEDKLKEKNT